ncbi:MAG: hypothetical protein U9Q04_03210 [Campylobacterota bacterium]|nr:hypothetical protein [Campylobacterota bacterium]
MYISNLPVDATDNRCFSEPFTSKLNIKIKIKYIIKLAIAIKKSLFILGLKEEAVKYINNDADTIDIKDPLAPV